VTVRGAAAAIAALLLASCAAPPVALRDDVLAARVDAALAKRGLERDTLQLIHNLVRHEPGPPPAAPEMVRELFADPLAAADAGTLFRRSVPSELVAFDGAVRRGAIMPLDELVADYIGELAAAQATLRRAATGVAIDTAALMKELEGGLDSSTALLGLAPIDRVQIAQASAQFIRATARLVAGLRAAGSSLRFPEQPRRYESAIGLVSIGTRGSDRHASEAVLIIDPGGDDVYERSPVTDVRVRVVIDLGGNDRYLGADVVVHGLAALIDFSGDDRYEASGPGLGAAVAGVSLLADFSGNDSYEAQFFGQGAAAFGVGALLDFEGDDRYSLRAAGQGFGLAGGLGLLWDRAGNDRYRAGGLTDAYGRGGEVSFAQGAAFGFRTRLAGGIGILRDDAGDDTYEAQMFAQGTGYYYGIGLAWDRGGDDRWRAVRYAQGNGVHEAVGVLRDESGHDSYELAYGVGQGMGLDLGVGVLFDAAGDDRYQATVHAQGNATSNGIGLLFDRAGADEWRMSADPRAWGRAEPARRLPSLGLLLYQPERASFLREEKPVPPPQDGTPIDVPEPSAERSCPPAADVPPSEQASFAHALRSLEFIFRGRAGDPATQAYVRQRLVNDLQGALAELPGDDFTTEWILGNLLPCVLRQARADEAAAMWSSMESALHSDPANPFALPMALALRERPAPAAQLARLVQAMAHHPSCGVRAAALLLDNSAPAAQAALRSSCWFLQATALGILGKLGAGIDPGTALPSILRGR
jgi:hypothetical protein